MLEPIRTVETEETPGAGRFVERAVGQRNEMPGARAAVEGSRPDPELAERAKRRKFTAAYKLRILREAAGATRSGEIAAMLRREGLYTSHSNGVAQAAGRRCARGLGAAPARAAWPDLGAGRVAGGPCPVGARGG